MPVCPCELLPIQSNGILAKQSTSPGFNLAGFQHRENANTDCCSINQSVWLEIRFDDDIQISNGFWIASKSRIRHPNILMACCSFTVSHTVWVVMPLMAGGSCLDIMKAAFANGFDEHDLSLKMQTMVYDGV